MDNRKVRQFSDNSRLSRRSLTLQNAKKTDAALSITTRTAQADSLTFKLNQKKLLIITYMNFNEQGVSQRPVTDHNKLT